MPPPPQPPESGGYVSTGVDLGDVQDRTQGDVKRELSCVLYRSQDAAGNPSTCTTHGFYHVALI